MASYHLTTIGGHKATVTTVTISGRRCVGVCPFPCTRGASRALTVNPETGLFYCYACKTAGRATEANVTSDRHVPCL